MIKISSSEKGFGLIGFILLIALVVAGLSAYSYFNPNFSLAKYSPLNYYRIKQDEIRIRDLKTLEKAILQYYDDRSQMPVKDGWCGRISGALNPELKDALIPYIGRNGLPSDPFRGSTDKDYWYYRVSRSDYILMAVLEIPVDQGLYPDDYNFVGCHDWPGNNIYNYRLSNID